MPKSKYVKASTPVAESNAFDIISDMTPEQMDDAIHWYRYASEQCAIVAQDLGIEYKIFVAVVAAISPGKSWDKNTNINDAIAVVTWYQAGRNWRDVPVSSVGYSYNGIRQAWRILDTSDVSHLSGPKVIPFYHSILNAGQHDVPAIDYHMVGAGIGWQASALTFGPKIRNAIVSMVETVAVWFGVTVAQAQSLIWQAQLFAEARVRSTSSA